MYTMYTANAKGLKTTSKGFAILSFIQIARGATKYDCVTKILRKVGSRQLLRGYYSCTFRGWVDSGVLRYDNTTKKYHLTSKGYNLLSAAAEK